jgi:hypothetical protein
MNEKKEWQSPRKRKWNVYGREYVKKNGELDWGKEKQKPKGG